MIAVQEIPQLPLPEKLALLEVLWSDISVEPHQVEVRNGIKIFWMPGMKPVMLARKRSSMGRLLSFKLSERSDEAANPCRSEE